MSKGQINDLKIVAAAVKKHRAKVEKIEVTPLTLETKQRYTKLKTDLKLTHEQFIRLLLDTYQK